MGDLVARCRAAAPAEGPNSTPLAGVSVYRRSAASGPAPAVYERCIFVVVQGRKQARVGHDGFVYDPDHYLVTSVPLPVETRILHASPDRPFLSLAIDVSLEEVREIVAQAGAQLARPLPDSAPDPSRTPPERGLAACPVPPAIRDLTRRLVALLDAPEDAPVLAPLYRRELLYHVLKGPRGGFLRAVATGAGPPHAIAEVLTALHAHSVRSFTVAELARRAGMSESVFYEAFRAVTGSTPIQYVKRLRLQEAHRKLTLGLTNVSGAAFAVGYNSLSQFSREFTRTFGVNPSACRPRERSPRTAEPRAGPAPE